MPPPSQKHLFQSHGGEVKVKNLTVLTGQRVEASQEESTSQERSSFVTIVASRGISRGIVGS